MKTKIEDFEVLVPNAEGGGIAERVKVQIKVQWDESLDKWLPTRQARKIIEDTKARRGEFILPRQMKELRERLGYSPRAMGELFQAGEEDWTRWEAGEHWPGRSVSLLIRALYEKHISICYLLTKKAKLSFAAPGQGVSWKSGRIVSQIIF